MASWRCSGYAWLESTGENEAHRKNWGDHWPLQVVVEVLWRIGLARLLFIDACGDVGRKLDLGKRVNLETGSCLGPGRHGRGRQDEARMHSVLWALA